MYEKTIANEHRIYGVVIPATPTLIIDLLSDEDLADYNNLINNGVVLNPTDSSTRLRLPIDGYLKSDVDQWFVASSLAGETELVPQFERFTFPVSYWPTKAYVYANAPIAGVLRIFFS